VPCLVLAFEHDIDSPPPRAREAAATIPGASYTEISGASHLAPFTHPNAVADALIQFLAPLPGSPRPDRQDTRTYRPNTPIAPRIDAQDRHDPAGRSLRSEQSVRSWRYTISVRPRRTLKTVPFIRSESSVSYRARSSAK